MSVIARGAYVELNLVHAEVMPSFWRIARDAGVAFRTLRPPVLLTLHNPPAELPATPGMSFAVLTAEAAKRHPGQHVVCIHALHAGDISAAEKRARAAGPPGFAVSGNHHVGRRNYGSLIRALSRLADAGATPDDFEIHVIGRWNDQFLPNGVEFGLDGHRLLEAADRAGVIGFLRGIASAAVEHHEFRAAIGACRYALPFIDDVYVPTQRYFGGKASGGINQAVGSLTIPVMNERLADSYGLRCCHTYRLDQVDRGIEVALRGDDDELIEELQHYRDERLAESVDDFRRWVETL